MVPKSLIGHHVSSSNVKFLLLLIYYVTQHVSIFYCEMLLTPQNKRLATTITILCIIYSIKPKSSVLVFDTLINIMEGFFFTISTLAGRFYNHPPPPVLHNLMCKQYISILLQSPLSASLGKIQQSVSLTFTYRTLLFFFFTLIQVWYPPSTRGRGRGQSQRWFFSVTSDTNAPLRQKHRFNIVI